MSSAGNRADVNGYERKKAKQADRRRQHVDKYAPKRDSNEDREMAEKLNELVARFNGEEADRG